MEGKVEITVKDFLRLVDGEKRIKELEQVINKLEEKVPKTVADISSDITYIIECLGVNGRDFNPSTFKNLKEGYIRHNGKDIKCFIPQL